MIDDNMSCSSLTEIYPIGVSNVRWQYVMFESTGSLSCWSHILSTISNMFYLISESYSIYCCSPVQTTVGDSFFKLVPVRVRFYLLSTVGVMFNLT
jgi:hypothetical protein